MYNMYMFIFHYVSRITDTEIYIYDIVNILDFKTSLPHRVITDTMEEPLWGFCIKSDWIGKKCGFLDELLRFWRMVPGEDGCTLMES